MFFQLPLVSQPSSRKVMLGDQNTNGLQMPVETGGTLLGNEQRVMGHDGPSGGLSGALFKAAAATACTCKLFILISWANVVGLSIPAVTRTASTEAGTAEVAV